MMGDKNRYARTAAVMVGRNGAAGPMPEMTEMLNEVAALISRLENKYPVEINAILKFMKSAESGPALSVREKELINIGICCCHAVPVVHRRPRQARDRRWGHARSDRGGGFMAVLMHGGATLMHLVPLFKALDEFLPE